MGSIKWKTALLYMILVVTIMIGQGTWILYNLRSNAYRSVFRETEYAAERIVNALSVQDMEKEQGAEEIFGDLLISLTIESGFAGNERQIYLLDKEGRLLYSGREGLTQADLSSRAILMARNGETMKTTYNHEIPSGHMMAADYALSFTLPQNEETYILFIRQSLQEVQEQMRNNTMLILTVTGIGIPVAGILGYILAVSIAKPIENLTRKTQELAGITDARDALKEAKKITDSGAKGDEIDVLETNFDDMARELTESIRSLQAMEQMQKDFVANVSHELRTPITTVGGYVETLLDSELDDPELIRRFLGVVYHESERMAALITDLLELSKMDARQLPVVRKPVEMGELLRENLLDMEWDAGKKKQQILWKEDVAVEKNATDDEDDLARPSGRFVILGEKRRIEQVIRNLLTNAIKYSPEGAEISAGIYRKDGEIIAEISDTGIGMAEDDLKHIFDRFYRVDKARSRSMGGTGLGLAIAKETTELYGGRISVESVLGEGSTFTLRFPEHAEGEDKDE